MIRKFDFEDWEELLKTKIIISSFEPEKDFKRQVYERKFALLTLLINASSDSISKMQTYFSKTKCKKYRNDFTLLRWKHN